MKISKKYLAGLFDGEGYIRIEKFKTRTNHQYNLALTNQHKGVLLMIQKRYGGGIYKKAGNRNECWQWEICNKKIAKKFLKDLIPHMIIKKEKAKRGLETIRRIEKEIKKGK